jgi:ABC-type oligopeptide transport system ATPase subunit
MLLEARNITKYYEAQQGIFVSGKAIVKALDGVSFAVDEFDSLGIVGESGCGKTTLAKIILKLISPTSGEVKFNPEIITDFRKDVQIIFQNPYNSQNPKMRIFDTIAEPLIIHKIVSKKEIRPRVIELLKMVGLGETALNRYPIEFSGGQRQRICLARALAVEPKLLVLDEPISSLDLTVQAEMLDLFLELKERTRLTYIFISHNLAVIKYIANKVIVMREGKIVEEAPASRLFSSPANPYTKLLLEAARA